MSPARAGHDVITLDQRGIGLSDRMTQMIDLETKVDYVRAVLDAAGSRRTTLYGQGVDGGAICSMFAATYPERTLGLLLWSGMPCGGHEPHYPWSITREFGDNSVRLIAETWGDEDAVAALLSDSGLTSILDDRGVSPLGAAHAERGEPRRCPGPRTRVPRNRLPSHPSLDPRADRHPPSARRLDAVGRVDDHADPGRPTGEAAYKMACIRANLRERALQLTLPRHNETAPS